MRHQPRHDIRLAALALAALGLAATGLAACSTTRPATALRDRDLGLSKSSVFEVPTPPVWKEEASAPGQKPLPPRLSTQIPPVIPHGVADFLPIRIEQNACADCHPSEGAKKAGEATPIPASHLVDLRRAPDVKGDKVAGARWVCTACHLTRTDAPPLVGSGFRP